MRIYTTGSISQQTLTDSRARVHHWSVEQALDNVWRFPHSPEWRKRLMSATASPTPQCCTRAMARGWGTIRVCFSNLRPVVTSVCHSANLEVRTNARSMHISEMWPLEPNSSTGRAYMISNHISTPTRTPSPCLETGRHQANVTRNLIDTVFLYTEITVKVAVYFTMFHIK